MPIRKTKIGSSKRKPSYRISSQEILARDIFKIADPVKRDIALKHYNLGHYDIVKRFIKANVK